MKKALIKDSVKEIRNTYKRFLSILLMAFLGVGFFAGIRATSPDMVDTINEYYNNQQMYDIEIISTLGLTIDDINEISKIENIENVEGTYETDGKLEIDNKEVIAKVMCIDQFNKPILIEGSLPTSENECVVEESFLQGNNKNIGDTIQIEIENTQNDDGEEIEYLKQRELKIVGTVQSPIYISRDRGTSKLGSGKINYYLYISRDNINAKHIYTKINIKVKDANRYITSSEKYEGYIQETKKKIEDIKEERQQARHDSLVEKATIKVEEAETTLNNEKEDAQSKIDEAEKKINDGKTQIEKAENTINTNKKKADTEFVNALSQIQNAKIEIEKNSKELEEKEKQANDQISQLQMQKQSLNDQLQQVNNGIILSQKQLDKINELLKDNTLTDDQKNIYEAQKQNLEKQIQIFSSNKRQLEEAISKIDEGITKGKTELENAKNTLSIAKNQIQQKENEYNNTKKSTYKQIEEGKVELEKSKQDIEKAEKELEEKKKEFEEKITGAEEKLIEAKEKINDIENPKWYILDRYGNAGYNSYIQDTQSVANIGELFPIVFFVVATLISLTSMTRMVEEQRTQIGTLKALRI